MPHDRAAYRVFLPIAGVSGLLLAVGVIGAWRVQSLQRSASDILAINVSSIRAAVEFEITLREMRTCINRFLLTEDEANLDLLPGLKVDADHWLSEAAHWSTTPYERDLVARMRTGRGRLYDEIDHLPEARRRGKAEEAARFLAFEVLPNEMLVPAKAYLDFNEQELAKNSQRNQQTADSLVFGLALLGTCGSVAGLVAGYGIAWGLNRRIVRLTVPIRSVAGKLDEVIGPVRLTAAPGLEELESVMRGVADRVGTVIEQWQVSQRKALHAEKLAAAGQLAAGLAHELRNPLMSMKILVESAAEQAGQNALDRRDLRVLEEEIERMEGLVLAFLDFARPPQPQRTRLDLQPLVHRTVSLVEYQADRRHAVIDVVVPEQPLPALVDPDQFRQLLLNLLLNAIDAVPDGGQIKVALRIASDPVTTGRHDPRWIEVEVADNGGGIPEALRDRLFEPFVSAKPTGLGLGLATCRRIAESHGGTLQASNVRNAGAVFTLRLPAAEPTVPAPPALAVTAVD